MADLKAANAQVKEPRETGSGREFALKSERLPAQAQVAGPTRRKVGERDQSGGSPQPTMQPQGYLEPP